MNMKHSTVGRYSPMGKNAKKAGYSNGYNKLEQRRDKNRLQEK